MILEPFNYYSPDKLNDALSLLSKYRDSAKVLAGGQSLIPVLKMGFEFPHIIDIKGIKELSYIHEFSRNDGATNIIEIGALTKYSDVERSNLVRQKLPLLSKTVSGIGHPLVRNRGTVGGSLAHCDPAADLCATALALNADVIITSYKKNKRIVPVTDFFKGTLTTDLKEDEIITAVQFKIPKKKSGFDVQKLTLGHGDFPIFLISINVSFFDGKFSNVSIALGGVADTAIRFRDAEEMIEGKSVISEEDISQASQLVKDSFDPPVSPELTPEYTGKMMYVFTKRAMTNAIKMLEA